jgi:hypothetical protein
MNALQISSVTAGKDAFSVASRANPPRAFSIQVFALAAHFSNAFSNEIECSFCKATTHA